MAVPSATSGPLDPQIPSLRAHKYSSGLTATAVQESKMRNVDVLCALCLLSLLKWGEAIQLALFASNGCYSHEVMMRELGEEFERSRHPGVGTAAPSAARNSTSDVRINWLQILMYDFGLRTPRPAHWGALVVDKTREEGDPASQLQEWGSRLLWETTVPLDHNRPWDLRGALFLARVMQKAQRQCEQFVSGEQFRRFVHSQQSTDLVVVDHFLQECFTTAAHLLNASATVHFSNWPVASAYISSMNVPSPPSAYPATSSPYSAKEMSSFFVRLRNTLFSGSLSLLRSIQSLQIAQFYASIGHPQMQMEQVEAAHLFYASRAEFFAEPVRPISNRIRHFGCPLCRDPEEYRILKTQRLTAVDKELCAQQMCLTLSVAKVQQNANRTMVAFNAPSRKRAEGGSEGEGLLHNRYRKVRREFPNLDWVQLERRPFVLVSFGSIAKVEFMPLELLRTFLHAFAQSSHLTNSSPRQILARLPNGERLLPPNVRLIRWAPIKILLAHPNLRYAILHGGINTVNEALMFGRPILGLPLQGDQSSNLQHLVDLGMGQLADIRSVWSGQLAPKMAEMERNYAKYAQRAEKVSAMVATYRRELGGGQQNFWLRWASEKCSLRKRTGHHYFHFFYRNSVEHFALAELGAALVAALVFCAILSR